MAGGVTVTSVEARIILGCIPLLHGFWSALPVSDKALWELTEKLYHAGVPWSSSLICCWTCWELSLYLASTLWKTRAEQLSCVSGALWVTREALGCAADCRFSEVPVVNVDFFFFLGESLPKTWAGTESSCKRMNLMEPVSWAVLHRLFPPPARSHPWLHCLKSP